MKEKEFLTKKYNEGLKNAGVFFAFSDEQFEEQRTYKEEEIKGNYVSLGMGAYLNKKDIDKWNNFNKEYDKLKKAFSKNVDKEKYILYELENHECFYTGNLESAFDVLKNYWKDLSFEEVKEIYKKNKDNYDY